MNKYTLFRVSCCLFILSVIATFLMLLGSAVTSRREINIKIFQEGYEAGLNSIPVEACPYGGGEWKLGWIKGKMELSKGKP